MVAIGGPAGGKEPLAAGVAEATREWTKNERKMLYELQ